MCRDDFLLCKQIQRKDKSQENIHQSRQDRGCRAPRHGEDAASLVADQGGDLLDQQVGVYGVFGQDNVIFCSKPDNACPPPPDFLHIGRNVLNKLVAGLPQAGDHHKHHGKQNPKNEHGACAQAHRAGQLFRSPSAHLVPAAFQRSKDYVNQKRNCATDQKWREQRKHLAEKTQNSVKVYQCPRKYNQQHQCADNVTNNRLVRPFAFLRRGILISVTGCVLRFLRHVSSFPLLCTGPFKSESTFAALYTHPLPESLCHRTIQCPA